MKKNLSLLVLTISCIVFYTKPNAQSTEFGVKGGLNIASLTGDVNQSVKSKVAFHAGILVEFPLSELFAIQPELLFSGKGYKLNNVKGANNYLDLPIMAKVYPVEGLNVEIGPQLSYLLSAKEKDERRNEDVKEAFKNFDFGLNFGAGYKLADLNLIVGVRYNMGLFKLLENNPSKIRNGVFQLSVGYLF